jgi:catechol 2,3-dioxygenase-like lactoylglutathione lyase family enzyme
MLMTGTDRSWYPTGCLRGITMTKLSHIELYVSDYAKSVRFYDKFLIPLGWARLVCQKSHTTFSDGEMKIVLCPTEEKYRSAGYHRKRIGLNHLAFYAPSKEAVDQLFQTVLKPNEVECLYERAPNGDADYYRVFFEDPDRIKIEVVYAPGYCGHTHWTNELTSDFDPYAGHA